MWGLHPWCKHRGNKHSTTASSAKITQSRQLAFAVTCLWHVTKTFGGHIAARLCHVLAPLVSQMIQRPLCVVLQHFSLFIMFFLKQVLSLFVTQGAHCQTDQSTILHQSLHTRTPLPTKRRTELLLHLSLSTASFTSLGHVEINISSLEEHSV